MSKDERLALRQAQGERVEGLATSGDISIFASRYNPDRVTPNHVTAVRALIVALLAGLVLAAPAPRVAWTAVVAGTIAAVLDGVDGWLARRKGMVTPFGARFDAEVDALLILVLASLAWRWGKAGSWVLMSGMLRYIFVAAGWMWPWMRAPLAPTRRARVICVVQIVALIVAVAPIIPSPLSASAAAAGLLTLAYSFLVDTIRLWRNADSA